MKASAQRADALKNLLENSIVRILPSIGSTMKVRWPHVNFRNLTILQWALDPRLYNITVVFLIQCFIPGLYLTYIM